MTCFIKKTPALNWGFSEGFIESKPLIVLVRM